MLRWLPLFHLPASGAGGFSSRQPPRSTFHRHGHCKLMAFKVVKQQEIQLAGRWPFVGHQLIESTKERRQIL